MGIDDVVAMALALQCPQVRINSVVACEGVAGREASVRMLGRMLDEFNRRDITLYSPVSAGTVRSAPESRRFAERTIDKALRGTPQTPLPFTPKAYVDKRGAKDHRVGARPSDQPGYRVEGRQCPQQGFEDPGAGTA